MQCLLAKISTGMERRISPDLCDVSLCDGWYVLSFFTTSPISIPMRITAPGHCYWWESVLSFKLLRSKSYIPQWSWETIYIKETRVSVLTTQIQASALKRDEAIYKNEWKGGSILNKCICKDKKTYQWSVIKSEKPALQERWDVQRTSTQLHHNSYLDHDCKK